MASAFVSRKRTRTEALDSDCGDTAIEEQKQVKVRRRGPSVHRAWKRPRDEEDETRSERLERPSKRHCKEPASDMPVFSIYHWINTVLRRVHFERVTCREQSARDGRDDGDDDGDDAVRSGFSHIANPSTGRDAMDWSATLPSY